MVGNLWCMTETTNLGLARFAALASDWSSQIQQIQLPVLQLPTPQLQFDSFAETAQAIAETSQAIAAKFGTVQQNIVAAMERELADGNSSTRESLRTGSHPKAVAARRRARTQVAATLAELETQPVRSFLLLEVLQSLLNGDTGTASKWLRECAKSRNDVAELRLMRLLQRLIDQLLHVVAPALRDWFTDAEQETQRTVTAAPMKELHQPPLLKRIQGYLADAQLGTVARAALCA